MRLYAPSPGTLVSGVKAWQDRGMSDHFIFGYGSLVNRATHEYGITHTARLPGWRRVWQHTTRREVAFLNVIPDPAAQLDGLIMAVPPVAPDLEAREYAYAKHDVSAQVAHGLAGPTEVKMWAIPAPDITAPGSGHALLLSYIDVVVAGYLDVFGRDGVARFFANTDGWQAPVWDDRAAPLYPRAQPLRDEVRWLVDSALTELPCWVTKPG